MPRTKWRCISVMDPMTDGLMPIAAAVDSD
jgi:hypothetical protein